ncbi:LURP-one-related/scramblase family protein [Vagococcus fluvialis]|uniref:LURP-one-related/scramblase family protein n=1 Tax=Vagococcus fluvialis TaxID=2738 RepID=UPI001D0BC84F|nr:LURP-one-related family protein [Vagococcus fluvialis]UDM73694.1 LURP-one-related family protein [Vagococcus fluvialis]
MRQLYMKQKMLSVNEKFSVTDKHNQTVYRVQGSLFKLAKSFTMVDKNNKAIGKVTKELFKLMPKFIVEVKGHKTLRIEKQLTLFKSNYQIYSEDIEVRGDILSKHFDVYQGRIKIATINQKWLAMTSTYEMTIYNQDYEHLIVLLVAAIDFLKAQQRKNKLSFVSVTSSSS